MDNLPLPVTMQLSPKLKTFFALFIPFFASALNFEHFEKKKKKKISRIDHIFLELLTPCLLERINGLVSENPLAANVLTNP